MTYQVTYESKNPPVAGLGFAAIRDLASSLKHAPRLLRQAATRTPMAHRRPDAISGS